VTVGDGGKWLRKNALILAKNNYTPASFWLSIPLSQLHDWITTNNAIIEEAKAARNSK